MVKNTKGGSGHKSMARKSVITPSKQSAKTRIAMEEGEIYAQVTKMLGGGKCHVLCQDGETRLCVIRGKFRGRGKRDNILSNGKWILVGSRGFESEKTGKMENCDLLEIYSDHDKEKLKTHVDSVDWKQFILNDCTNSYTDYKTESDILFTDEREDEYEKLTSSSTRENMIKMGKIDEEDDEEEEIDIDDI